MSKWLLKSEPSAYSWQQMQQDITTKWDGVRNFQARNNMMKMKKGDLAFFYHSNEQRAVVGIISVEKEYYPDDEDNRFVIVEMGYNSEIAKPVRLSTIKSDPLLANIPLIKQSRLSVMPITPSEWDRIIELSS